MSNLTIYGQICFWDDNTVQVFLSVSKKEYYLLQQFTKSYEFIIMVIRSTKNEATQCPPPPSLLTRLLSSLAEPRVKSLKLVFKFPLDGYTLFRGSTFKWDLKKLNFTWFRKPDINCGSKIKSELAAAFKQ